MFVITGSYVYNRLENSITCDCIYTEWNFDGHLSSKAGKQYFVLVLDEKLMGLS